MGFLDSIFGGGSYGQTVKKNTVPGRLTYAELKKMLWELHEYIDEQNRQSVLAAMGTRDHVYRYEVEKIFHRLHYEKKLSDVDLKKILAKLGEYF